MASVSTHGNQDKGPHLPPPSKQSFLFCPKSKLHIHRGEIAKIIRECQEESFWKRGNSTPLHIHVPYVIIIILQCESGAENGSREMEHENHSIQLAGLKVKEGAMSQGIWVASRSRKGYLAANPRFGSLPKVAIAGILGFGLGKASYIGVCQSKFHSFEEQLRGAGFGPGHNRHCLLTCEECKIQRGLREEGDSQPSAS
ncbi:PREDICTED: OCIA domain-containing protein 2 [Condylura cristata]|uniref:OCIA domain-containing protein 2 n=1 Tax=Condylura cristata TaxID=143302 RepID=UPI0006431DC5|nr:PREDICTED: OCIA domain-containing protein 2 [Condylura cristata]